MVTVAKFKTAPESVTVGTSSVLVLAANTNRYGATFVNDSVNKIYLAINADAVSGKGILIVANGGSYEINNTNITHDVINAIATGAGSELVVLEANS